MRRKLSPAVHLAVLSMFGIFLNFLYQWYVLTQIGPGRQTDAFFAGMMIPQFVLAVVSGSLSAVMIPLLATEREQDWGQVVWTLFQGMAVFWALISAILIGLAPFWVPLTVPGFDEQATQLTVLLSRIQLVGLAFPILAGVEAMAYHSRHRFLPVEVSSVIAGVIGFGCIVWGLPRFGIVAAAWAAVLRSVCQVILQLPALGTYHAPRRHASLRKAWRRALPLLAGASYYKADRIVDRMLTSMAPPGALSLYQLAIQVYASAHLVLNRAIVAPIVPVLAQFSAADKWKDFARVSRQRLRLMLGITLLLLLVLVLVGRPVLVSVLAYGDFSPARAHELWWILLMLGGMWVTSAAGQVLSISFYTRGDTRTPTRIGVIGFTVGIGLKLAGFKYFGVLGLAAAASAYYAMNALAFMVELRRALRRLAVRRDPLLA